MSTATKEALDNAIAAHFADENDGAMLNGYLLSTYGMDLRDDEHTVFTDCVLEGQDVMATLGIVARIELTAAPRLLGYDDE